MRGGRDHVAHAGRTAAVRVGLGQSPPCSNGDHERRDDQHPEHRSPAERRDEVAACRWRERVAQHGRHGQACKRPRDSIGRKAVGHDYPRDDQAGGRPEGLDAPPGDQPAEAGRGEIQQRARDHDRETRDHRPATAVTVGERPPDQDPGGEGDERDGEGRLHRGDARAEVGADVGQRRQIQVGRNRPERRDRREQPEKGAVAERLAWWRRR
jgi:hypothetical protein